MGHERNRRAIQGQCRHPALVATFQVAVKGVVRKPAVDLVETLEALIERTRVTRAEQRADLSGWLKEGILSMNVATDGFPV